MQSKTLKGNTSSEVTSKPLIVTWLTHRQYGVDIIPIDEKSMTVPDMTLSLQELLLRHTQGREVPEFHGFYDDEHGDEEEFYPDLRALDLAEIQEIQEATLDHVARLQKKLSDEHKRQNEVNHQVDPKETSQTSSDPKQQSDAGATKPAEGGKPQTSGGQSTNPS